MGPSCAWSLGLGFAKAHINNREQGSRGGESWPMEIALHAERLLQTVVVVAEAAAAAAAGAGGGGGGE